MLLPKAFAHFNGFLYVPGQGRYVLKLLETGGARQLLDELERLSKLGSPWASAMLGYIALMPRPDGTRDVARALELCRPHAHAGDSYAQFVYAWALILSSQPKLGFESMQKAAVSGFAPAAIDLATIFWNLPTKRASDATAALQALKVAHRAGHKASAVWKYAFYKSGRVGLWRRPIGYLFAPFARLRLILAGFKDPFASRVFVFQQHATSPLLRDVPRPPVLQALVNSFRENFRSPSPETHGSIMNVPAADSLRLKANRRLLLAVYAGLGLVSALVYLSQVNVSFGLIAGSRSGLGVILIVLPAMFPYVISGYYAWQLISERRLGLYLFLAATLVGSVIANLVITGSISNIPVTFETEFWYVLGQTAAYGLAAEFLLGIEWP